MTTEVEKVLDSNARRRPMRGIFYAFLTAGGLILLLDPSKSISPSDPSVRWVWSGFLVVGGLFTLMGTILDRWRPEIYGLPLQISSFLGLIYVLVAAGFSTGRFAVVCFLAALVTVMVSRGRDLLRLAKATEKMKNHPGQRMG